MTFSWDLTETTLSTLRAEFPDYVFSQVLHIIGQPPRYEALARHRLRQSLYVLITSDLAEMRACLRLATIPGGTICRQ